MGEVLADSIYSQYCRELRTSIARSLRTGKGKPENENSFSTFIPLWTLVHGLRDVSNVPNPTKLMLMSYLRESGNLPGFIDVSRDHRIERSFNVELQGAHQAMLFTSYFDELISDSLLFVNAFHLNNYRGCMIALRCMLEDLYRHLYYKDNREHFIRVHELGVSENELKLAPATFRGYLESASYLKVLNNLKWKYTLVGKPIDGLQKLNTALYGKTSASVHGSAPKTLNGFESNLDFEFNKSKADEILSVAGMMNELSVAFLCCGHLDQFSRFNETTKRIVVEAFLGKKRSEFRTAIRI
jgi:hypothetical protein